MRAGAMKYKLNVYRPVKTVGRFGEISQTWELYSTIRAERVDMTGRRTVIDSEVFSDYTVKFNVRALATVKENWRVEQLGGYTYTVVSVIPTLHKGMLTLVCDRLSE